MGRALSLILVALGAFCLTCAGALKFYAGEHFAHQDPYYEKIVSTGTGEYFAAERQRTRKGPVTMTETVREDVRKRNGDVGSFEGFDAIAGGDLLGFSHTRSAIDRRTGTVLAGEAGSVRGGADVLHGIWPENIGERNRTVFDPTLGRGVTARFMGTERVHGLTAYRFRVDVPVTDVGTSGPLGGLAEVSRSANGGHRYYESSKRLWIEPRSGIPLKTAEYRNEYLGDAKGQARLVLFRADVTATELSVEQQAGAARALLDEHRRWQFTGPLIAAALGAALLAGGVLLYRAAARSGMTGDTFRVLFVRRWRVHPGRLVLSITGVASGVALAVSSLAFPESLTASSERLATLASGADLQVTAVSDGGLDAGIRDELARVPGVSVAASFIQSPVYAGDTPLLLLGADERSTDLAGGDILSCLSGNIDDPASLQGGLFVNRWPGSDVRTGKTLTLSTGSAKHTQKVTGVIDCDRLRDLNGGYVAAAYLPTAQRLAGKENRVDLVNIRLDDRVDGAAVRAKVEDVVAGRGRVASPGAAAAQVNQSVQWLKVGMLPAVGLALLVAILLTYDVMSRSVNERRRELAVLRALGATRRRLVAGFALEAVVLGAVGAGLGLLAGTLLARVFVENAPTMLTQAIGLRPVAVIPAWVLVVSFISGIGVAVVGALLPMRVALRIDPADAAGRAVLAQHAKEQQARPVLLGLGVAGAAAGAVGALTAGKPVAICGLVLVIAGLAVACLGAAPFVARAAAWVAARWGGLGRLAEASLARVPRRTWGTSMAVAVSVMAIVAVSGLVNNQISSLTSRFDSLGRSQVWVSAAPFTEGFPVRPIVPGGVRERLAQLPGVAELTAGQGDVLTLGRDHLVVVASDGHSNSAYFNDVTPEARDQVRKGTAAVLSEAAARRLKEHDGWVTIPTASGPRGIKVAQIVPDLETTLYKGSILLSQSLYEKWSGRKGATWFEIRTSAEASPAEVRRAAEQAVRGSSVPIYTSTGADAVRASQQGVAQASTIVVAIQWVVMLCVGFVMLNTFSVSVLERRRELAVLRALGATRRQIRATVLREAIAVGLIGGLIGVAVGTAVQRAGIRVVAQILGTQVSYQFVWTWVLIALLGALAIVVVGAAAPAWRAGRGDISESLSEQ